MCEPVAIGRVIVDFDPDWDHAMESVLMTRPEETVPFLVRAFDQLDRDGQVLLEIRDLHSGRFDHQFPETLQTSSLTLRIHASHGAPPQRYFGCGCLREASSGKAVPTPDILIRAKNDLAHPASETRSRYDNAMCPKRQTPL